MSDRIIRIREDEWVRKNVYHGLECNTPTASYAVDHHLEFGREYFAIVRSSPDGTGHVLLAKYYDFSWLLVSMKKIAPMFQWRRAR